MERPMKKQKGSGRKESSEKLHYINEIKRVYEDTFEDGNFKNRLV